ncbi:MAG: (2Fe-2S)-binding protein [Brachybacterium sp.]|nr:(2Fe-2S)-binding protein [Brachybacterium sp.]
MRPPREDPVRITVDGRSIDVPSRSTVASVLMADGGAPGWRTTRRRGEPRGLFCGIGVCYDCLVTVDDHESLRSCLIQVRDGMSVTTDRAPSTGVDGSHRG